MLQRLTTFTAGTLAAVALAASPAAAQSDDLRSPDARAAGAEPAVAVTGDGVVQDLRTPDARTAGEGATPVIVRVAPAGEDAGISWDSAAIGALIASGVLIMLPGAAMLRTRRRARPAV